MKKIFTFAILTLFLFGFVSAGITGSIVNTDKAQSNSNNENAITTQNAEEQGTQNRGETSQIQVREQNRLRIGEGECAEGCTCTGSSTKCQLQNGREMTIRAGKSGNTIIQIKGEEMETKVQLYKEEGKLYGFFKNDKTREIKMMPDQVREKIQERLQLQKCLCEIDLDEDGNYQTQAQKRARFLGIIPVREKVKIQVNSETGEITRIRNSWWGFLAKDIKEEQIVGASCGTVTPGQNNACCQNKGYDVWNSEKGECLFNASE